MLKMLQDVEYWPQELFSFIIHYFNITLKIKEGYKRYRVIIKKLLS